MRSEITILLAVLGAALLSMPVFALGAARRGRDPHEVADRGSFVLGGFLRNWFFWFQGPVDRTALALGLGPLVFNLLGVAFGVLAAVLFAQGHLTLAGWAILLGGWSDVVDGRLARALGVASEHGAFLDSTLDRFAEFAAFVGLAVLFQDSALVLVLVVTALGGSLLVSYARARGESVGVVCKVGIMQRAERLLLLGFGAILDPAVSAWAGREQGALLAVVLGIVAAGTLGTAVYRTWWIAVRLPKVSV
ncbi:MAG: CDP-alcohol phosphatidyltransferase family protein [Longimicrobiales bacterium]